MGYNTGDTYEEKIFNICKDKNILPVGSSRAGAAGNKADIIFIHNQNNIFLEVKNSKNPDYGQKKLDYDSVTKNWMWVGDDDISKFYTELNLASNIDKKFEPIWYKKRHKVNGKYKAFANEIYTMEDFKSDQSSFKKANIEIPLKALFKYYGIKNTFYIQIEGSGFYHLEKDIGNIGTDKFDGEVSLRLRCKHSGHTNNPPHACQFLGALKLSKKPTFSKYDLEENLEQLFPPIIP